MSIFSAVDKDLKSLGSEIEAFLEKVSKDEPKVEPVVSATLTAVGITVEGILAVTGQEAEAAAIAAIVSEIQLDLATVNAVITTTGTSPTLNTTLNAIVTNLKSILASGNIKDPATVTAVTAIVNLAVTEIEQIEKLF